MTDNLPIPPPAFPHTGLFARHGKIEDLTPVFLKKNYLLGLTFVDELGKEYPDEWYEQKIAVALSVFEHQSELTVNPFEVKDETHDYYIRDYEQYAFIQLHHYPVIVDNVSPVVRAVYPTGQVVTTFPREWIRTDMMHGQIQLIPTQGSLAQVILGQGGSYLPIIYQGLGYLPHLFRVDYTTGFRKGEIPQVFIDAVCKLACIEILSIMGDSVRPTGVTSQSYGIDGLSESRGFMNSSEFAPVFSGRINQYKRELFGDQRLGTPGLFGLVKSYYRGINMIVTA